MKATLSSTNHDKQHHELTFVVREKEILILCDDKEVASLTIETMENGGGPGGEYFPTENFWLHFHAKECSTVRNIADVIIDPAFKGE